MKFIFRFLKRFDSWKLFWSNILSFILALVSNTFFPTKLFVLKFLLLTGILNILIFTLKHRDMLVIRDFGGANNDPILSAEKVKLKKGIYANYNIAISLAVSAFFIAVSIYLRFISFDLTGIISLVLLFMTIFISIIGYIIYLQLIHFFFRLSNVDIKNYSKFYPAYTHWLVELTKYSSTYQNAFFISGTLYVILFAIHAPDDTLKILTLSSVYTVHDVVLSVAWIVITFTVVIGFPITSYLKNRAICAIVSNLKIKSSEYYEAVADKIEIGKRMDYIKLIKEIVESADYPVKRKYDIAISSITSIINLIIAFQKIYPHFIKH